MAKLDLIDVYPDLFRSDSADKNLFSKEEIKNLRNMIRKQNEKTIEKEEMIYGDT
jgi:hypothetical protein